MLLEPLDDYRDTLRRGLPEDAVFHRRVFGVGNDVANGPNSRELPLRQGFQPGTELGSIRQSGEPNDCHACGIVDGSSVREFSTWGGRHGPRAVKNHRQLMFDVLAIIIDA